MAAPTTQIVNFRYTFLPSPIILAVPIPRDEWRTVALAQIAIDYLAKQYTTDIKKTFRRDIPSALVIKFQDRRETDVSSKTNVVTSSNRPRRQAQFPELTDAVLRGNTSLAHYVNDHDDCIIDVSERPSTRVMKYAKQQIAGFAVLLAVTVYLDGNYWITIALGGLGGYMAMLLTCECKVYSM